MILQKQSFFHKPEQGQHGDCHRTVIACLLDIDKEEVPNWGIHYDDPDRFNREANEFLASRGVRAILIPMWGDKDGPEGVLNWFGSNNPNLTYMLTGKSKNGTNHVVICRNNQIIWDTAIDDSGIVAPTDNGWYFIEVLISNRDEQSVTLNRG